MAVANSEKNGKKALVQSVERALNILKLLAERKSYLRSIDISAAIGVKSTTGHNLIRTLYRRNYLSQDEYGRYGLGAEMARLSEAVADRWAELRVAALPFMTELNQQNGDGVFLGVLAGNDELHCVAFLESRGNIKVSQEQNWLDQLHCTGAGKILLAQFSEERLNEWLAVTKLKKFGPHSITSPTELRVELKHVRECNWSQCLDESGEGVGVLAVPVFDGSGRVIAAISQCFPAFYFESGKVEPQVRIAQLKIYAGKIGTQLVKNQKI